MGQLVLSRKKSEVIVLHAGTDEIRVMVVEIQGDKVRLGVDAPRHVSVHRAEIQAVIDAEGKP